MNAQELTCANWWLPPSAGDIGPEPLNAPRPTSPTVLFQSASWPQKQTLKLESGSWPNILAPGKVMQCDAALPINNLPGASTSGTWKRGSDLAWPPFISRPFLVKSVSTRNVAHHGGDTTTGPHRHFCHGERLRYNLD